MIIKNILTHLVNSLKSQGKKISNSRKLYVKSNNKTPLTYFKDSFLYRYKISQICTYENYYPNSKNDSNWEIIKKYRITYPKFFKTQFKTTILRWQHDPEFNIESFKKGTKQAISVITKNLHENKNTNSYLSYNASKELEKISNMWSRSVRENIALEPYQILQILILEINNIKYTDATLYEINTLGVGYKPFDDSLLEILILARFERIYSKLIIPEWNVTQFNILRMKQIPTT